MTKKKAKLAPQSSTLKMHKYKVQLLMQFKTIIIDHKKKILLKSLKGERNSNVASSVMHYGILGICQASRRQGLHCLHFCLIKRTEICALHILTYK